MRLFRVDFVFVADERLSYAVFLLRFLSFDLPFEFTLTIVLVRLDTFFMSVLSFSRECSFTIILISGFSLVKEINIV